MLKKNSLGRRKKGVALIWFALIAVPVIFFSCGIAVDFNRIFIGHQQIVNSAQEAAVAGAFQFSKTTANTIDQTAAKQVAADTWELTKTSGAINYANFPTVSNQAVASDGKTLQGVVITTTPTSVTITITYTINNLIFSNVENGLGESSKVLHISKTASICQPGVASGPTQGYCTRPQG